MIVRPSRRVRVAGVAVLVVIAVGVGAWGRIPKAAPASPAALPWRDQAVAPPPVAATTGAESRPAALPTPEDTPDFNLDLSTRMGGGLVACAVGPSIPDGGADVTLEGAVPLGYPRDRSAKVWRGRTSFGVPPGSGSALIEEGSTIRARVRWSGAEAGGVVECTGVEGLGERVAVHGRLVDEDGRPALDAWPEGCGVNSAYFDIDPVTAEFVLYVEPGACELRAVRRRNMGRSDGPPVAIAATEGRDIVDVVLEAARPPEWRDSTPEESASSTAGQCEYWAGQGSEMVALMESIAEGFAPGTEARATFDARVREAKENAALSRAHSCEGAAEP